MTDNPPQVDLDTINRLYSDVAGAGKQISELYNAILGPRKQEAEEEAYHAEILKYVSENPDEALKEVDKNTISNFLYHFAGDKEEMELQEAIRNNDGANAFINHKASDLWTTVARNASYEKLERDAASYLHRQKSESLLPLSKLKPEEQLKYISDGLSKSSNKQELYTQIAKSLIANGFRINKKKDLEDIAKDSKKEEKSTNENYDKPKEAEKKKSNDRGLEDKVDEEKINNCTGKVGKNGKPGKRAMDYINDMIGRKSDTVDYEAADAAIKARRETLDDLVNSYDPRNVGGAAEQVREEAAVENKEAGGESTDDAQDNTGAAKNAEASGNAGAGNAGDGAEVINIEGSENLESITNNQKKPIARVKKGTLLAMDLREENNFGNFYKTETDSINYSKLSEASIVTEFLNDLKSDIYFSKKSVQDIKNGRPERAGRIISDTKKMVTHQKERQRTAEAEFYLEDAAIEEGDIEIVKTLGTNEFGFPIREFEILDTESLEIQEERNNN